MLCCVCLIQFTILYSVQVVLQITSFYQLVLLESENCSYKGEWKTAPLLHVANFCQHHLPFGTSSSIPTSGFICSLGRYEVHPSLPPALSLTPALWNL